MEVWKDIKDYEGLYQVSNMGRVKSINHRGTGNEHILQPATTAKGYHILSLCKNGKPVKYRVHRLVADAFCDNPDNKPCVDHINAVRNDNRAENLRWVTSQENAHNPIYRLKTFKMIIQHNGEPYKYTGIYTSIREAEAKTGTDHSKISKCALGKMKTTGGYKWTYADDIQMLGQNNIVGRLTKVLEMS